MTYINITGFICALVLALLVIAWIAYCMFCRERHKNELHYDISDIRKMNYEIAQTQQKETATEEKKTEVKAGIFILPSRHKQKDDYYKRPDYPEGPVPIQPRTDNLVEILDNYSVDADVHYKDGICDVESKSHYHSDV